MFAAFKQLFLFFTTVFTALTRLATASNHLAGWAEKAAETLADEGIINQQIKLNQLKAQLEAELRNNPTAPTVAPKETAE